MRDKPLVLFAHWGRSQTVHYYQGYGWLTEDELCTKNFPGAKPLEPEEKRKSAGCGSPEKEKPRGNGAREEGKQ